ncbi:aminotransferase class I/II-fold pyridoxal phosphate-dependent enzyme [Dehalobacter sp. DCM]|uniref:pyridoxal phosphate-dependent aminotransferase n=1 Tax=Dehalobacter sp. DCM TaxID=2907827 RepID=UPI0030812049|nr:aminotransferase class I/II-fold pyridoxal phosphate-dependent enzyme [Dehalobacter sp. DCM]
MYEYSHGGDIYSVRKQTGRDDILDYSSNVNPLGLPEAVKRAVLQSLDECVNYPDPFCRELIAALAEYENVDHTVILAANGAAEIIFRLVLALKPQKALLFAPTFSDYEKALHTVDCSIDYYSLLEANHFSVTEAILNQINNSVDMLFICNPNNPTGQLCSKELMLKIIAKCRTTGTIVVVDECFMDFVENSAQYSVQSALKQNDHMLILKAFTKIFAMPGFRLGYVLTANMALLEKIRMAGQDWSVSAPAQFAGICALQDKDYLRRTEILIKDEREFLIRELKHLGFQVFGSRANYIFFKTAVTNLAAKMLEKGIMIRSCANYINLSNAFYRIAVKNHEDNLRLIAAFRDVINDESHHGHY